MAKRMSVSKILSDKVPSVGRPAIPCLLGAVLATALGSGTTARADHLVAWGLFEVGCGGTCTGAGGDITFTWAPNDCIPDCLVTPTITIENQCSAITAIQLHVVHGTDPCAHNDTPPFPMTLTSGAPFTLTKAQLDTLLTRGYVVWAVMENPVHGIIRAIIEKYLTDVPAVSEWALAVMTLLLLAGGTLVLAERRRASA